MLGKIVSIVERVVVPLLRLIDQAVASKPKARRGLSHADAERQAQAARNAGPAKKP